MSDHLAVAFATLHRGPVHRQWRLQPPVEGLGPLPGGLGAVGIDFRLKGSPRDGVRVQGSIQSTFECECRRCLSDIILPVRAEVDVWFRTESQVIPGEDGVWAFAPGTGEIELAGAIREELLLTVPSYPVCAETCVGLCASCGARLAEEECKCPPPPADPRWAVLTELGGPDEPDGDPSGGADA